MTPLQIPSTIELELQFQEFPTVVTRGTQVLWCLTTPQQEFIVSRKNAYPAKIYRFVGGGVEPNESIEAAALRELIEETSLPADATRMHKITTFKAIIRNQHQQEITFYSHLFHLVLSPIEVKNITPDDDIDEIKVLTVPEFKELITAFKNQPQMIDNSKGFSWFDYGQLFGPIHQLALDYVTNASIE